MSQSLVDGVVADLRHLAGELHEAVDDHSLRRSSSILRRLLVDNDLQRAWKASGRERQPSIHGPTLDSVLAIVKQKQIVVAFAGGARYKGAEVQTVLKVAFKMPPEEMNRLTTAGNTATVPLNKYGQSPTIIVQGTAVTRLQLIKYVANKLGGVHHDTARRNDAENRVFRRLDHVYDTYEILEKNAVFFELLAIGQTLVQSQSIREWIELPPRALDPNAA